MRKTPTDPFAYSHLSSHTRKLVPTLCSPSFRDSGRYESTQNLPSLDLLLDRTLKAIAQSHDSRERSDRSFDALWEKVCRTLGAKKNAAAYERWKRSEVIKNITAFRELDEQLLAAWLRADALKEGCQPGVQALAWEHYESLKEQRAALQPDTTITTDDLLEVAIAYWIEAKNAREARDDLRVLHALIECSMHIGMTLSPKTESESKSEAGAKQGEESRDRIASIAATVLREMPIDARMKDPTFLLGTVVETILHDPEHAKVLKDFDEHATKNKKVEHDLSDRFTETLMKWAKGRKPRYPDLAQAYRCALGKANRPKSKPSKRAIVKPIASY